ncbi:MAG: dihydrolipoyl dehydrogenase [Deltaproteobacteria bacterium]|nr:MAG: dihydrolipoyl dehydrogenase [Pseudomonadota bacterium]PIE66254.1 MAG: dihydrolipoyl dehydrogenase [Deltaproteobacteria bacterium]
MERYDVAVIGAGPGGYVAAIRAAQLGKKTALIEKRGTLGGTCLNVGCIPSKALLESSELYSLTQHKMASHGIEIGEARIDVATMQRRKDTIVSDLVSGIAMLMKKNKVDVYDGHGRFSSRTRIVITASDDSTRELEAERTIIATGSDVVELPFMPFDGDRIISSTEALALDAIPEHLIVIGAGAIGLEMGSVWARLGAKVTVVELMPTILPFADAEMSKTLHRVLKKQGLAFKLGCKVTGADVAGGKVTLRYEEKGAPMALEGDRVLVAVGRRPYTDGLGLEAIGVETERGRIPIDAQLRTAAPNIYAIGDVVSGPMLAHKAEDEGVAVAEIICGKAGHVNYEAIPNIVYTWPELAQVGLTEQEAKDKGHKVNVGKFRFVANGRAKTLGDTDGLCKIVADARTDRMLGAHIVGPRASDMIAELVVAMEFSASAEDVARSCHAHPTLAEIVKEAAMAVDKRAIHG